jgi:hypothetical protein
MQLELEKLRPPDSVSSTSAQEEHPSMALAVPEHHFDNHKHCGVWCSRTTQSEADRLSSNRCHQCKTKDAELHNVLNETISQFVAPERLDDVAHGMDNQVNESLNFSISITAPKNTVFCGTRSSSNWIVIAVGIASVRFMPFCKRLYNSLGLLLLLMLHIS